MSEPIAFAAVLDAAERLDEDAQAELVAVLSRRLSERGRERVAATVAQARSEFASGQCQAMTAAELIRESSSRGERSCVRPPSPATCVPG